MDFASTKCYSNGYMQQKENRRRHSASPVPPPVRRALRHVADDVATWRKLRGLTQAQLADRSGVSRDTIGRLEGGDGGVSVENLLRLLRALGILDSVPRALDPYETDVGRLRSDEQLPQRVRPRRLTGRGNG
jgi:DNA-binding XRE family transcriptional regulator